MTTYTTIGSVRGSCGHKHRTREAAQRCLEQDKQDCAAQGGYSDRLILASDSNSTQTWITDETTGETFCSECGGGIDSCICEP